jgi:predicted transcriptional regulator
LPDLKVDTLMQSPVPSIHINEKFKKGLDLLINHPFLCVVDDEETFVGILTRRVVLKQLKKHIYQNN